MQRWFKEKIMFFSLKFKNEFKMYLSIIIYCCMILFFIFKSIHHDFDEIRERVFVDTIANQKRCFLIKESYQSDTTWRFINSKEISCD